MIRPNLPIQSNIVCLCPFCGDKSFVFECGGQYCLGIPENSGVVLANIETTTDTNKDNSVSQNVIVDVRKK
jgi:hypothetical protein